ncbi:hypothetical protein [Streptomyces sp. NPDC088554]|uniref:hypothetical protein n=1 Tax=Streptomyces sp. NPDC088554 TaxID=3365865 RepID=UPI00380F2DDD
MIPTDITALQLRPDDTLCGMDGVPFAIVSTVDVTASRVWATTKILDRSTSWFPVEFLPDDIVTVLRPEETTVLSILAGDIVKGDLLCTPARTPYGRVAEVIASPGDVWVSAYTVNEVNPQWFPVTFQAADTALVQREALAHTGRPSKIPLRAAAATAAVTTALALSVALAQQGEETPTTAPSASPVRTLKPYLPEPRVSSLTSRQGTRAALPVREEIAKPSATPTTWRPIPVPPADIRISFYQDCTGHAQECIDAGELTMYGGRILAGHNYLGYQWLSRIPVGRTVRVLYGPLEGTYKVYGHLRLSRQGGAIPSFGGADLVLQTCEGSGTGFSLARRVK